MLENNIPHHLFRNDCIISIFDLDRNIKVVEDTCEQCHRSDPVDLNIQKAVDRHVDPSEERNEHRDITDREFRIVLHHDDAARQIDQHRTDTCKGRQDNDEPASRHALFYVEIDHPAVGFLVSAILIFFLTEQLNEELSAYRQSLI